MKQFFTTLLFLFITCSLFSQAGIIVNQNVEQLKKHVSSSPAARLGIGESLTLAPNPVTISDMNVEIKAVNVLVFSYHVYTSTGQIVEIENLSGRPNGSFFRLPAGTLPGLYLVKMDTDSGPITRKLQVV
jgi:hypothetical protein